ncbi:MAG: glycosyltransferase family 39 protein, partial [Chloroflexota bacterium]
MIRQRFWLILILLLGFALRLTWLGEQSLWYDEGVTWLLSQMSSLSTLIEWTAADIQPPLYYLLIWYSDILLKSSEWALRFPSVVFNTLTIPVIYVLASRLLKRSLTASDSLPYRFNPALLAAFLFAISPLMVYYSQEARMYTLLVFEATLSSYLLIKILHPSFNQPTRRPLLYPILYALTATAALYTHYFAAFLLTAQGLYALIILFQQGWSTTRIRDIGIMFGGAALLFAPWLTTLLSRLSDDPSYWPGALKLDEAFRKIVISFVVGETVFEETGFWLTGALL